LNFTKIHLSGVNCAPRALELDAGVFVVIVKGLNGFDVAKETL
jgi:hypothetical protein